MLKNLRHALVLSLLFLVSKNIFALTDQEAIDPLLKSLSVAIKASDSYDQKLKYSIPAELAKRCSELVVNGTKKDYFKTDSSLESFVKLFDDFHAEVQKQGSDLVTVTLCQKTFTIEKKFIGQGKRSFVYALADGKSILKVPKGGVGSLLRMVQERDQYPQVDELAKKYHLGIGETTQIGKKGESGFIDGYDDSGLFAVKKRFRGETLSDYFFRYKILTIDEQNPKTILVHKDEAAKDKNTQFIWSELKKFFAASKENPDVIADLKSTNFMVTYKDGTYRSEVNGVYWVDTGKHEVKKSEFYRAHDFSYDKYLENMKRIIQEERDDNVADVHQVKFEDIQKDPNNLPVTTLFGNKVRLAEVSQAVLDHLLSHLKVEVCARKIKILAVFSNGSRVATRDKVLELEPSLKSQLPLEDDGVVKNSIRNGGITNHSNLSMVVVIDKASWPGTTEQLREYSFQVSAEISKTFRQYPLTIRFKTSEEMPTNSPLSSTEFYYQKALEYQNSRGKTMPRSSTARLDSLVPFALTCPSSQIADSSVEVQPCPSGMPDDAILNSSTPACMRRLRTIINHIK